VNQKNKLTSITTAYLPPVEQLLALGKPAFDQRPDYAALGLARGDVPALIRMATDDQLYGGTADSLAVWAPIHAWQALVQLRADEAIGPLVNLFHRLDDDMDDWISTDLPVDLAQFGGAALESLTAFLADTAHGEWARNAAAKSIGHIAELHPELRADCLARLGAQLERFTEQTDEFNALLISPLWDLRAVELLPLIERAYAAGRVDEAVHGDLEDVQIQFGLKSQREHPRRPNRLTIMGEKFRAQWTAAGLPLPDSEAGLNTLEQLLAARRPPEPPPAALALPFRAAPKTGRNDPCPCGSGKKFKKCCGA
jgi:SEC-C motif/Protein of unknown function (DUF1186)